ncbi:MAG TPA: hypothetical protein VGK73_01030 [Polyangiaceae bacterium]
MSSQETAARPSRPPAQPLVFMRFRPVWAYIDGIREFCRFFCATTFSGDVAERASVVVQETLENAVKYSTEGENSELELMIESRGSEIEFSVSSLPDPTHLGGLRDELTSMESQTPEEAYVAAFIRAASSPESVSRIGLARIRHEGRAEITLKEESGGRVRITATSTL